jgi:predicted Zn-dependent peptidase
MFFKGTARRSALDIAKELDAVGGFANAFTSKEHICLHAKVLDKHLPRIMDILSDIFLGSTFDPIEIEREREVILQEIHMIEDTPDDYAHVLFQERYWKDNPLGRPIYGREAAVRGFDRTGMLRYLSRALDPRRLVVAAAGNVDHSAFLSLIEPSLGTMPPNGLAISRSRPREHHFHDVIEKDIEQVHLCLAIPGCSQSDENRFRCHIANVILGSSMSSRLFQEVREKRGLAYSVYSFVNSHEDTGMLGVYAGVGRENVSETLGIIGEQVARFADEAVPEAELEAAKEHIKGGMYLSAENTESRMNRLAKNEILFGRMVPYEETERLIDRVSSMDIQDWFRTILPPGLELPTLVFGPVAARDLGDAAPEGH